MNEQEMREVFREMREEPIPADSLARVRMAVGERIQRRRVSLWKLAAALVLAGGMAAAFLSLRPGKPVPRVIAPEIARVLPRVETPVPFESPVPSVARPRRIPPRARPVEAVPVSIRIETPDPDVVILLVN